MITTEPALGPEAAELITVTVCDRSREAPWGVGLTSPIIREVRISACCPHCGARRWRRSWLTTYDDGERYWTETRSCSAACGQVDHYADVVVEADRIASARLNNSGCSCTPPTSRLDPTPGDEPS